VNTNKDNLKETDVKLFFQLLILKDIMVDACHVSDSDVEAFVSGINHY